MLSGNTDPYVILGPATTLSRRCLAMPERSTPPCLECQLSRNPAARPSDH
jgi:hypothetical protein